MVSLDEYKIIFEIIFDFYYILVNYWVFDGVSIKKSLRNLVSSCHGSKFALEKIWPSMLGEFWHYSWISWMVQVWELANSDIYILITNGFLGFSVYSGV